MTVGSGGLAAALADRYRLERELGKGGMATVYLARDIRHDRDVAIKMLHPDLGAALGAERFLSEIKVTAKLQHPHILPLLDSGDAGGLLYYVMPLATGETLRDRLTRERQLPIDEALRIAREVGDALGYAHTLGIIHRDIKPENILLQGGHALVADFGIALAVQQAGGQRLTQTGLSLGTPQYMSPEQAIGERAIDARSDIYALGAVTYEMLVGEPPFTGPTVQAVVARVLSEEPRGLTTQRRAIPDSVEDAVLRALEKLPADRFTTAAEFASALGVDVTSAHSTRGHAAARRRHPRAAVASAVGLAMAALAALALWGWLRPIPAPDVVRYRIDVPSVGSVRDWTGRLAISPDGSVIAHVGGPRGTLLLRRRNELAFTPMPWTEGAQAPFFSPDGVRIGYFAGGKLMAAPLAGGPPVVLDDSVLVPEASWWGEDGYIYRNMPDGAGLWSIARMEARPGAPLERVTTVDTAGGELSHFLPELLPSGNGLLFHLDYRDGRRAISLFNLATGRQTILFPGVRARYARSGHLLYSTNDGKLWSVPFQDAGVVTEMPTLVSEGIPTSLVGPVDFAVSATGTLVYAVEAEANRELVWVTRTGRAEPLDTAWTGTFSSPSLSPDGSRIAVSIRDGSATDIWIKRVAGGAPARLSRLNKNNDGPMWTPDGRSVTYLSGASDVAGTGDVWSQLAERGSLGAMILHLDRPISEHVWSPSGGWLAARTTTAVAGAGDILVSRPPADTAVRPIVATEHSEYSPSLSPDGRWMAYVSNESGQLEVYLAPFPDPGSARWQISTKGGIAPLWSRRGGEVFYLDMQSNMVSAEVRTTPGFSLEGTRVLFSAADYYAPSVSRRNYDVAPDGQRFLMVRRTAGGANNQVVVVERWFEELRGSRPR